MISLIVAVSENGVIGKSNEIPWHLPRDLKHFKELTRGNTVVMGRKTFESIMARLGKPLPERKNVILTRQKDFFAPPECVIAASWEEVMKKTSKDPEVFVCGGEAVYAHALPFAERMYLTRVHAEVEGESRFPEVGWGQWRRVYEEQWPADDKNPLSATYQVYDRVHA